VAAWQLGVQFGLRDRVTRRSADDVALGHVQADRAVVRADQFAGTLDEAREQRLERELTRYLLDHLREQLELRANVGGAWGGRVVADGGHRSDR
jgi:hypothetical protein